MLDIHIHVPILLAAAKLPQAKVLSRTRSSGKYFLNMRMRRSSTCQGATAANPEDAPQLVFETPTLQTETEQPQQITIKTPAKPKNSKTRKTGSN
jgi:hypothetical protein